MNVTNVVKGALAAGILFASSNMFAQQEQMQKKTPDERATMQTQWMQKNLSITDDQAQKVHDVVLKYAQQADNAPRDQRQTIMANRDADLKSVLTANQFQQYQAHEQQMRQQMQQRRNMQQQGNQ